MHTASRTPPPVIATAAAKDGRTRRVLLGLWAIAEVWRLAAEDPDEAQNLLDQIVGQGGLIGLWLEGSDIRTGLKDQIEDVSSDIVDALRQRFSAYLTGNPTQPSTAIRHPNAASCATSQWGPDAWSIRRRERTGSRHPRSLAATDATDHLASLRDTHLCPVCLAELQLRRKRKKRSKGSGDLRRSSRPHDHRPLRRLGVSA